MTAITPRLLHLSASDQSLSLHEPPLLDQQRPSLWLLRRQDHPVRDQHGLLTPLAHSLLAQLSPLERLRWQRQRHGPSQDLQLLARAGLRQLLGRQLRLQAAHVPLTADRHGKPQLACERAVELAFNLSHAGDLVLIGLHHRRPIGVDLEAMATAAALQAQGELLAVAAQVLSPRRCHALSQLKAQQQQRAFLRQWCRREAQLKALGVGLVGLADPGAVAVDDEQTHGFAITLLAEYEGYCCVQQV